MRFLKPALIGIFILVSIAAMIYFIFLFFSQFRKPSESPYKAVPENASLIIRINDPDSFLKETGPSNPLWKQLSLIPAIHDLHQQLLSIDSMMATDKDLWKKAWNNPWIISLCNTSRVSYGYLLLTKVHGDLTTDEIREFIGNMFKDKVEVISSPYASANILKIILRNQKKTIHLTVCKGILVCSFESDLVIRAIDQLSLNIPSLLNREFQKIESTTGQKVEANLYIHYPLLTPLISDILRDNSVTAIYPVTHFAEWTGVDIHLMKDEILINGYTTFTDSSNHYTRIFDGQVPQKITLPSVLPDNIYSFTWIGTGNIQHYYQYLVEHSQKESYFISRKSRVDQIRNQTEGDLSEYFLPWTGDELCAVSAPFPDDKSTSDHYAVVRVNDERLADSLLKMVPKLTGNKTDSIAWLDHTLFNMKFDGIIPGVFHDPFLDVTGSWYMFLNGYIFFANSSKTLKSILEKTNSGMILGKNSNWLENLGNMTDDANFFYYVNIPVAKEQLLDLLSNEMKKQFRPVMDSLKNFGALTFQLMNRGNQFYSILMLRYEPGQFNRGPLHWQATLDTLVSGRPLIVKACRKGNPAVLALDKSNNLYLIDSVGSIVWKYHLTGKPLGEIHEIFLRNSDSSYYILNTDNMIVLVNGSGQLASNYPVMLPQKATAGLSLFSITSNSPIQILIPLADNKVHNFDLRGKPLKNWLFPSPGEEIDKPVQQLKVKNKDVLIITGKSGHLMITDNKGKRLIKTSGNPRFSANSKCYINKTNRKGVLLTTSNSGKVIYIKENGQTSEASFNIFTPDHTFFYTDINQDGTAEFIFFDKHTIYYYNRFYKLIYSYSFPHEIRTAPILFEIPGDKKYIGVFSEPTKEIYLFGKNGLIPTDAVIRGTTGYDIGKMSATGGLEMIIGSEKNIRNYHLSQ